MLLLELFCGTKSIGKEAEKLGIRVVSLDFLYKYQPTILIDIMDWDYKNSGLEPDIIWASPDCSTWSLATYIHRKNDINSPTGSICKTDKAIKANLMVDRVLEIIDYFKPKLWFIENPRARLRKYTPMLNLKRKTIYYGNYEHFCLKPTDIWTNSDMYLPHHPTYKKLLLFQQMNIKNTDNTKTRRDRKIMLPTKVCEEACRIMVIEIEHKPKLDQSLDLIKTFDKNDMRTIE